MEAKIKAVFLLPMKRNSDRVKGKNFRNFAGKPLYLWMLETAANLDFIDSVIINTDAQDLIDTSLMDIGSSKVIVRQRRAEICGDFVSMNEIIKDDIEAVDADVYLMSHTTNPLLCGKTISNAFYKYLGERSNGKDSLFSVNKIQTRFYDLGGNPLNHNPSELIRTQDLEPMYEENSCLYIFSRKSFMASSARIGLHPLLFETPLLESLDIDTEDDWSVAEAIAKQRS